MVSSISEQSTVTIVTIKMFGGFDLTMNGVSVSDSSNRAHQVWNLLEYLVAYRKRDISQTELIDALWASEDCENPSSAVKNLVYRARAIMEENNIPGGRDLIVNKRGTYLLNPAFQYEVDTEQFEEYYNISERAGLTNDQRIEYLIKAISLYTGNLLPKSEFYPWVVPLSTYYYDLYAKVVKQAVTLLDAQERYDEIVDICNRAIIINKFEEGFHEALIRALINSENHTRALSHYEYISNMFYSELGVQLSESLRGLYRDIVKTVNHIETDLKVIKEDLLKTSETQGAFYCDYEVFRNFSLLEARAAERTGQSIFLGLLTLGDVATDQIDSKVTGLAMQHLQNVIRDSLRKGDVISRFSATQYVLMIPTLTYENGLMVLDRIAKQYKRQYGNDNLTLRTTLQPLDPI